jgi:hypothetical protein
LQRQLLRLPRAVARFQPLALTVRYHLLTLRDCFGTC